MVRYLAWLFCWVYLLAFNQAIASSPPLEPITLQLK